MTDSPLHHFLLVYDHSAGELVVNREFERVAAAMEAYEAEEEKHRQDELVEVVLIGSDSLETVKITHPNYFGGTASPSKYLVGI